MDTFCVHDIDEIMESLDCAKEGKLLYYHFNKPFSDLDIGLYALASHRDINHLSTFMGNHKLVDAYTKHGKTIYTRTLCPPTQIKLGYKKLLNPLIL